MSDRAKQNKHTVCQRQKAAGFTLVEMLVAVFVLMIALTAAFTAAQRSLFSSITARDQVIGFYLTQEAFELIKNKRDSNIQAGGADWRTGILACQGDQFCMIDFKADEPEITLCSGAGASACEVEGNELKLHANGYYTHESGKATNFYRYFTVEELSDGAPNDGGDTSDELKVTVTTKWNVGIFPRTFSVSEFVTKWRHQP